MKVPKNFRLSFDHCGCGFIIIFPELDAEWKHFVDIYLKIEAEKTTSLLEVAFPQD